MRNNSRRPGRQSADSRGWQGRWWGDPPEDPPSLPRALLWCAPDGLKGSALLCLLPGAKSPGAGGGLHTHPQVQGSGHNKALESGRLQSSNCLTTYQLLLTWRPFPLLHAEFLIHSMG